ncbi:FAD-dependent oxidoreductase [Bacillus sp. CGMCC 1.16541]|uniref:phytoene desaturase family protein n=1 Tax=Bacillus sp. CGMCC 1.16541 TaxID=2185143 RepID=UPI000D7255CC|nr:FAD-dependent oxidoreductase [Bacillus sp. CGMCC 1.16541]
MHDVIVVGTGFGGLTSAALLAKRGMRVLTLEAANELGGSAGKFDRQGFRFAAGATVGMGFEKDGLLTELFHELEMNPPSMQQLETIMNVYLPDRHVMYFAQKERWFEEAGRVFEKSERIQAFFHEVFSVAEKLYRFVKQKIIFPPVTIREWKNFLQAIDVSILSLAPYLHQSVYDRLRKYELHNDKAFMTFLNGQLMDSVQTTAEYSPSLLGYMALSVFHRGAFYVHGGLASVIEALSVSFQQNGGELKMRSKVISLKKSGNHWRVETKRGDMYEANQLIVNAPIHNIFELLADQERKALPIKQEKEEQQTSWGAFTLYVGAKEGFLDEKSFFTPFHQFIGTYDRPLSEGNQFLFSVSSPDDDTFAPDGKRAITISTHTEVKQWWNKETYEGLKDRYVNDILYLIEKRFNGFSAHTEVLLPGTPVTFQRFTQRKHGLVGGYVPTSKYSLFKAYSPNARIEGLWFCGDTVFPGAGSLGSSLSGWTVANELIQTYK